MLPLEHIEVRTRDIPIGTSRTIFQHLHREKRVEKTVRSRAPPTAGKTRERIRYARYRVAEVTIVSTT